MAGAAAESNLAANRESPKGLRSDIPQLRPLTEVDHTAGNGCGLAMDAIEASSRRFMNVLKDASFIDHIV